jgi:hypothetical protein
MVNNLAFTSKIICKTEGITPEDFVTKMVASREMLKLEDIFKSLEEGPDQDMIEFTFNCPEGKTNYDATVSAKFKNSEYGDVEGDCSINLKTYSSESKSRIQLYEFIRNTEEQSRFIKKNIANIKALIQEKIENARAGQRALNKYFKVS